MRTVTDDGIEYEVQWDGAHGGQNLDLFRRHDAPLLPPERKIIAPAVERNFKQALADRTALKAMLQHKAVWRTDELRRASGLPYAKFWAQLQRLTDQGVISHPERGVIAVIAVAA